MSPTTKWPRESCFRRSGHAMRDAEFWIKTHNTHNTCKWRIRRETYFKMVIFSICARFKLSLFDNKMESIAVITIWSRHMYCGQRFFLLRDYYGSLQRILRISQVHWTTWTATHEGKRFYQKLISDDASEQRMMGKKCCWHHVEPRWKWSSSHTRVTRLTRADGRQFEIQSHGCTPADRTNAFCIADSKTKKRERTH